MASARIRSRGEKDRTAPSSSSTQKDGSSSGKREIKRAESRSSSNVFAIFSQDQIQEFKESSKKEKKSKKKDKTEEPKEEEAGGEEETKSEAKPAKRGTSNVFALFNQSQIQEFKESDKKVKKSKKKDKTAEEPKEDVANGEEEAPKEPKRAQRATSNVFALFNQAQIQEFKEAFTMMDQNRDGIIDQDDLVAIFNQIGRDPDPKVVSDMIKESPNQLNFTHFLTLFGEKLHGRSPATTELEKMLAECPGPLNFTMFLSLFGDQMKGTDPESTLRDAFKLFDENGKGVLSEEYIKDLLMNTGDQFNKDEIKQTWKEIPCEGGQVDYLKFVAIIKRGKEDE